MSATADRGSAIGGEVYLSGDGVQMARQFRDLVLHPVINSLCADQGGRQAVAFISCLLLQCAMEIRAAGGDRLADAALDEVRASLNASRKH